MKRILMLVFTVASLLSACGAEKGMEAHSAWMRPTAQGENGAVYFVLHNHSSSADELVGASSDAAQAVEIHESITTEGDIVQMTKLASLPLDPFAEIEFEPGGLHIMLVGLKEDYEVDDHLEIVLHFKNNPDLTLVAHVEGKAPEEDHPHQDDDSHDE
jgi:copper(I)-binding protein